MQARAMKMLTFSNARVYLAIAEEALCESVRLRDEGRRPRPNGEPGWILTPDPEQRSFKQALIAIVFSGAYLEAILRIVGRDRLGPEEYGRIEYGTTYEKKLERLGIADPALLGKCERLRESRNEVVHEKALEVEVDGSGAGRHVAGILSRGSLRMRPRPPQRSPRRSWRSSWRCHGGRPGSLAAASRANPTGRHPGSARARGSEPVARSVG